MLTSVDRLVDVLLVGGGVASVRCARTLRRLGFDGSILIVGAEDRAPYNRPPLSKELLREDLPDELLAAEPESWYARRAIALRTGARVVRLEPDAGRATLDDGTGVGFERCLIATGAELRRLAVPGAERVLMLRTAADAHRLRAAAIGAPRGAPVAVVGGGFIGLEVASAMATLGLRPVVVEMAPMLWGGALGSLLAEWATDRLDSIGVELRLGSAVTEVTGEAVRAGDEMLPAELVVAGIGVIPRVELAVAAGLATGDGILVDAQQRTSHPAVWAAGDVARVDGRRVEHWHAAREAGERAASSMLGSAVPPVPAAWVFSEVGGVMLDVIGEAGGGEDDRWIRDGSVLAYLAAGRVIGMASIGSVLEVSVARSLVERGASADELEHVVRASAASLD